MQTAVQGLNARGILVVASAGNDGIDTDSESHIPSSLPVANVIAVAAMDIPAQLSTLALAVPQLSLWAGSNYGTHTVHMAAPGVQACAAHADCNTRSAALRVVPCVAEATISARLLVGTATVGASCRESLALSDRGQLMTALRQLSRNIASQLECDDDALTEGE